MGDIDFDQNRSGRRYASTAPETAPQPLCPKMTTTRTLSLRALSAKSTLPMQTSPSTFPATRITNRSLNPWPKSISVGTRASEQPTTTPNGVCLGISLLPRTMPTSDALQGTTYRGSPSVDEALRQLSIHRENVRLPSSSVRRALSASLGSGLADGFVG